jgi:hypothetical protein
MARSNAAARDVEKWLAFFTAILVVACEPSGPRVAAENALPPGVPSDTTKYEAAVAAYAINGPDNTRERKVDCWYFFCDTLHVNIRARGDTRAIDPNNPPDNAVPVAHMVNLSDHKRERWYGLLPHDSAWYDLWVYKDPDTHKAVWALVQMSHTADAVIAAKATRFAQCVKGGPYLVAEADFAKFKHKDCTTPLDAEAAKPTASLAITGLLGSFVNHLQAWLFDNSRLGGGWIDCANGCCT